MPTSDVTLQSNDLQNPLASSTLVPPDETEKSPSAKIRLVRWFSSRKQVFVAELLLRSKARSN